MEIPPPATSDDKAFSGRIHGSLQHVAELRPVEAFQILLPLAATEDLTSYDLQTRSVVRTGSRILYLLAALAAGGAKPGDGIARNLQRAWAPEDDHAASLINAALILCADHELNASAFTARCVASTGATLYAVVTAALSAFQGYKHGGASEQVEAFFREVERRHDVRQAMLDRLRRGEGLPGFGHVIYRDDDPRGKLLLRLLQESRGEHPDVRLALATIQAAAEVTSLPYNVDLALAALARVPQPAARGRNDAVRPGQNRGLDRPRHRTVSDRDGSSARARGTWGELPEETTSIR